ncbi:MAG: hypothetical protein IT318_10770, partial [Anaerolineales bacterium]|nr:hypothetical protein [Anaerolineales bacterium]
DSLEIRVNDAVAAHRAEGVWVAVPLPADLSAGNRAKVTFEYRAALAQVNAGAWGWRGTLGWTGRQVNLGDWHPALAPHTAEMGWLMPEPAPLGEYATTPLADFEVAIQVLSNRRPVLVAGSGQPRACEATACFAMTGGRYPAYVVSERMLTQSITTTAGVTVTSIYMPEDAEAGGAALRTAAAAAETFAELYGAYPFSSFVQVEGDFYDGMEYSGLSFVGASYYGEYDGTPNNLLTVISAHEVAHQWWHTLVANDQAGEPWLDEALCTYSELLFLERQHPEAAPWWWAFRIQWFAPSGAVNSTIYTHGGYRGYVDSVYLRGAQMLHAMRQAVGDARFSGFLRDYAAAQAGRIVTGQDFWNAFMAAGGDAAAIQAQYFANP